MKRLLIFSVSALGILVFLFLAMLVLPLGFIIERHIERNGQKEIGVPITLSSARGRLISGSFQLKGLKIGNPPGYKMTSVVEVDEIKLGINPFSLVSEKIVIKNIELNGFRVTVEGTGKGSNINKLKEYALSRTSEEEKRLEVKELNIRDAQVKINTVVMGSKTMTIDIADVHLQDLGSEGEGLTFDEFMEMLSSIFFKKVQEEVKREMDRKQFAAGRGIHHAGDSTKSGVKKGLAATREGLKKAGNATRKFFGDVKKRMQQRRETASDESDPNPNGT